MLVKAFSPGHITGFFQICDKAEDLLHKGSRGAGISVNKGVTTAVELAPARKTTIQIQINGHASRSVPVSERVVTKFLDLAKEDSCEISINHEVALPIGCGFGTSGAGALSLALALNEVLELHLSRIEAAQIAHIVEIECQTGLGTVIAEMVGGIEIRVKPGAPGVGEVELISAPKDIMIVCLPFGPIPTPHYLRDVEMRNRINEQGGELTDALQIHPTIDRFLAYSRQFAEHIQILTDRVKTVFQATDAIDVVCSTAIFGENVFTIVPSDQVQEIKSIFEKHATIGSKVLIMNVDLQGARVLYE